MSRIKNVSFDLWLTIINSNPKFKEFLIDFWSKELNQTKNYVKILLRNMKNYFVVLDEHTGIHSNLATQFHYLYTHSGYIKNSFEFIQEKVKVLYPQIEQNFLKNCPVLYDKHTKETLQILKDKGIITNILSNTGIIQGHTLNKALEMLGVSHLFDYKIYSDVIGYAKPNSLFFNEVINLKSNLEDNILHVGDNPIADGGCVNIGFLFLQINSNKNTIKKVLEYV